MNLNGNEKMKHATDLKAINAREILQDIEHDIEIFGSIIGELSKVAAKIVPLVVDIKTGSALKGIKDAAEVLEQSLDSIEAIEKDLDQLKTPYLKETGRAISDFLEKITNVIDIVVEEVKNTSAEVVSDVKTLHFAKAASDIGEGFKDIIHEITKLKDDIEVAMKDETEMLRTEINPQAIEDEAKQASENLQSKKQDFERNTHDIIKQVVGLHVEKEGGAKKSNAMQSLTQDKEFKNAVSLLGDSDVHAQNDKLDPKHPSLTTNLTAQHDDDHGI